MLDRWNEVNQPFDDKLNAEILKQQVEMFEKPTDFAFTKVPYFSPSSVGSCPRELYMRLTKAKRDQQKSQAHQGRWRKLGELYGQMVQTDLLFIEKYYDKLVGEKPAFIPDRTPEGYPFWEDFADTFMSVKHNGRDVYFKGKPDGVLIHQESGRRIGLEIKSKQTTSARTSNYSMKEVEAKHRLQCVVYSIMFGPGLDDFIVYYGNMSKKSWIMTEEDIEKNPDARAFHIHITDSERNELLDSLTEILDAVEEKNPPQMDLSKFTFNNYKTACAQSLTADELADLENQVNRYKKSRMPEWKKMQFVEALEFIKEVRDTE